MMFYDRFVYLCSCKGVTPSRGAIEAGLSKSTVTKWKGDPYARPTGTVINKLTAYFNISVAELFDENPPRIMVEQEPEPYDFYQSFLRLCRRKKVSPSRAAEEAGFSKSCVTKWKNDPASRPSGNLLTKLAEYFSVPISELLGEPAPVSENEPISKETIKFALFGGSDEITDEMYEEVRSFAAFVKEREAAKRRKE